MGLNGALYLKVHRIFNGIYALVLACIASLDTGYHGDRLLGMF